MTDLAAQRAIAALDLAEGDAQAFDQDDDMDEGDMDDLRDELEAARQAILQSGLTAETGLLAVAALLAAVPRTYSEDHPTFADDARQIVASVAAGR